MIKKKKKIFTRIKLIRNYLFKKIKNRKRIMCDFLENLINLN